jgi:hypothetical protein
MAQIAIPLVIAGALYLMSNDKKEEFTNPLVPNELQQSFLKDENTEHIKIEDTRVKDGRSDYYNNMEPTSLNPENEGIYSQYQDKYLFKGKKKENNNNVFKSLAGTEMSYNSINHNNMQIFYNNKSNGSTQMSYDNDIKLDRVFFVNTSRFSVFMGLGLPQMIQYRWRLNGILGLFKMAVNRLRFLIQTDIKKIKAQRLDIGNCSSKSKSARITRKGICKIGCSL